MSAAAVATARAGIQCPDALRGLHAWCVWNFEQHGGEPKPRKVPRWVTNGQRRHGEQGGAHDRQHLVTFDTAQRAAARFDGIGFCLLPGWGITALDFDNCITPEGLHPEVERLLAGTYAEFSPSGTGVHAFFMGQGLGNRKDARGKPYGVEVFSTKGFLTFTGSALPITAMTDCANTVADLTPEVLALCAERFGSAEESETPASGTDAQPLGLTREQLHAALAVLDPSTGHDRWLRVGMALHHETRGEGFDLWDEWSSTGVQYPGTEALQQRWDSFGRGSHRPVTAHSLASLAAEHGHVIDVLASVAEDFDALPSDTEPTRDKPLKFKLLTPRELLEQPAPQWIVKGVVPQAELMVIFGETGSGKTFAVLDMFAAVARGVPWMNQATKQGRVVYIVAEGRAGFRNRVQAYCKARDADLDKLAQHFAVLADTPNLLQRDDAAEIVRVVGRAAVIVVDTFAQTTPGANENAADDMGKALANCRAIHRATGALVVLVHHTGKDQSRGARGWSGLKAAADAELEISKTVVGRAIRVSKQKDGEGGRVWGFELDQVPLQVDDDGDVITSCVIREVAPPVRHQVVGLGKWQKAALAAVAELGGTGAGVSEAEVITAAIQIERPMDGKRDRRAENVRDALKQLAERNVLELADGLYRIL